MDRRIRLIALIALTSVRGASAQAAPEPATFSFGGIVGVVPVGWTRNFTTGGGLRMAPADGSGASLDVASLTVPGGLDSGTTPLGLLRQLPELASHESRFHEYPDHRAVGVYDANYLSGTKAFCTRAYTVAIPARGDTIYFVTATAMLPLDQQTAKCDERHLRTTDATVLGIQARQ